MSSGRTVVRVLVVLAAGLPPALAQQAPASADQTAAAAAQPAGDSLAATIGAITAEYSQAKLDFYAKIKGLDDEAVSKMFAESYPKVDPYRSRMQSALAGHEGEPAAAAGLAWIVRNAEADAARKTALDALLAHHLAAPEMIDVVQSLAWGWEDYTEAFLENVSSQAPSRELKGQALFALAQRVSREAMGDPPTAPERARRAEELLTRVRGEYGDIASGKQTLADQADPFLWELQHLRIGMTAPEIEGTDIDGNTFRLSDYRGKVVVLDFWGFW